MTKLVERLEYSKNAVKSCLESEAVRVDFKGIKYWAGEVERLREEIKTML